MVKRVNVTRSDHQAVLQQPVAKSRDLGLDCKITFVPEGTRVELDGRSHITDKEHWLDMDADDLAEIFDFHPEDLDEWYENVWSELAIKLEATTSHVPECRGGIVTASATNAMISSMAAMTSATHAATTATAKMIGKLNALPTNFGTKVVRPPVSITVMNKHVN